MSGMKEYAEHLQDRQSESGYPGYPKGEHRGGKVIAEYIYDDEQNNPFQRVERTEDKQFPQSHWVNGDLHHHRGHWKYGAPSGPKIPYRLPQLIAAPPEVCAGG
jgi:hypothetical protein